MDKKPFDFDKYGIDPSFVLRKIWSLLQNSLSKQEVDRLNAIFVSEDIFTPGEVSECHNSQAFLQLLGVRSKPQQKALAINIICSEPVHQGVREAVQTYFPNNIVGAALSLSESTSQTSASNTAMGDVIIVRDNTQVDLIINALVQDTTLGQRWPNLGYALGMDTIFIDPLKVRVLIGLIDLKGVLRTVIEEWMHLNGTRATVAAFCKTLENQNFIFCKENVEQAFRRN